MTVLPATMFAVTSVAVVVTSWALFAYTKRDNAGAGGASPFVRRMFLAVAWWQISVGVIEVYFDQWALAVGPFCMALVFFVMRRYWSRLHA